MKQEWYDEGKTQIQSPGGNKIMVYSMERTLCDILRKRGGIDKGIVAEAFKRYVVRTDKNIPLLSEYAKKFHVEDKVRTYLEACHAELYVGAFVRANFYFKVSS